MYEYWIEILCLIKNYGTILCAAAGVGIAWNGLSTWKKQLKSSARYDIAQRMLHTVAVSSPIIRTLNNGVNMICAMIEMHAPPEKMVDFLDAREINKLVATQVQMELLKEEALVTIGEETSQSYCKLYDFVARYSGVIRLFPKILESADLRAQLGTSLREFVSKTVPLVTAHDYMKLMSSGQMPEYHSDYASLVRQVKEDITPYLRHSSLSD